MDRRADHRVQVDHQMETLAGMEIAA
jgi:hypothetical protein